jgi:translocation and assembly module TamB
MLARGPVDAPVITFSSMPPLSSEEIVLMLTAGEIPRNELATTQQQRAGRLAMFFGRQLLMQFGADEAAAERLEIRTGEELTEQATPTYYLEYRLDERWSVTGEYDRFNALNAGLKWRLYSK